MIFRRWLEKIAHLLYAARVWQTHTDHMNDALRILLANEPLAYREILADAFREHRAGVEVLLVEPEALELGAISPGEDLVICSRLTRSVAADALAWVELYPGVAPWGVACVAGVRETIPGMGYQSLLAVIDRAAELRRVHQAYNNLHQIT